MTTRPKTSYRPEIDGLRAVSVIGVLLYHAGLGLTGGYIGVDVFFVISGFLITSIILKEIEAGSFRLRDFWVRRIRRILPASTVMVAVVLLMGALLLEPWMFRDLAKSSIAQSVMLSNVHFWQSIDYFSESADFKPLLHTWSLAVEEQFYFFFPFTLAIACRYFKSRILILLAGVGALSLLLSIYTLEHYQAATFFSLPTRAWELLAGAILAKGQSKLRFSQALAEGLSMGGLGLILATMWIYDVHTPFPGAYAILPVFGAVALIAGSGGHSTLAGRLLARREIVFVGLISYSLYLWHWPLFAFAKNLLIDVNVGIRLWLVGASFALAILSWRFVEQPFRRTGLLTRATSAFTFGAVTTAILLITSVVIWRMDGIPQRINTPHRTIVEDIRGHNGISTELPTLHEKRPVPDFVLWGDSHASAISDLILQQADKNGLIGETYLKNGTIPIANLWSPSWSDQERQERMDWNQAVFNSLIDRKVKHLILASRWASYCSGQNASEIEQGGWLNKTLVTDEPTLDESSLTPELSSASVHRQLNKMLEQLAQSGTNIWLIKQVPETNNPDSARHFYLSKQYPNINKMERYTLSEVEHLDRQKHANEAFSQLESQTLTIIDPGPRFFDNPANRLEVYSERSHYRDSDHLTPYGVNRFLGPMIEAVFEDILSTQQPLAALGGAEE